MKIQAMLPIAASGLFEIEIDAAKWEKMSEKKKQKYFLDHCERPGYICRQCSNYIETDFEH